LLYIDQPDQVGLSYDVPTNLSYNLVNQSFSPLSPVPDGRPNYSFLNGTFSSNNPSSTANTTQIAANAVWHFLQTFLASFPVYNPGIKGNSSVVSTTGVNLFAESYGGLYGPVFAELFEKKNALRRGGQLSTNKSLEIKLTSLGIVNGIVDFKVQVPYYATFAYNNTYGIRPNNYDQSAMNNQLTQLNSPGGCVDQITQCRALMDSQDPEGEGDVAAVNSKCSAATRACNAIQGLFDSTSGRDYYDIRQKTPNPFPSQAYVEYLNTAQVQAAIGTPLNFTSSTDIIYDAFSSTGDQIRGTQLAALARLLYHGVHVALLYGDADFICNWQGGEAVSLALASMLPNYASNFPSAGYADIVVNNSYVGGVVRQFGNLSFARIYDAGHFVPAYQPETAFQVFARIISGTALSTGETVDLSNYHTSGPQYSTKSNKQGSNKDSICWIRNIPLSCTDAQKNAILLGQGFVFNGVWYASQGAYKPPASSVQAGKPGTPAPNGTSFSAVNGSPTVAPTGVYVATGTPKPSFGVALQKSCLGTAGWCGVFGVWVAFYFRFCYS
jgi:carboxypeptidase C (cathepsin A)